MAGALSIIRSKSPNDENHEWTVEFARFFNFPSSTLSLLVSSTSRLTPLSLGRARSPSGFWLPAFSQVSLQLSPSLNVISVQYGDTVFEEHFVSKLLYSWPQVSCIPGFPARGSRSIFMCYRDPAGKVQKFSVRFLTLYEAEAFINTLARILEPVRSHEPPEEISLPSDFMSSNMVPNRPEEELSVMSPPRHCSPEMQPSMVKKVELQSHTQERTSSCNLEAVITTLPPSFTSLLTNCCSSIEQASAEGTVSGELDHLKSQIARYMEDTSFQDMLFKVEKIIGDIGYI